MKEGIRVNHPIYNLLPTEIEGFDSLAELAGQSFEVALAATRAGNLFTTHTAVAATEQLSPEKIPNILWQR